MKVQNLLIQVPYFEGDNGSLLREIIEALVRNNADIIQKAISYKLRKIIEELRT